MTATGSVHHAFIFDEPGFGRELAPLLENAFATGDDAMLADFVRAHLPLLVDPVTGSRLDAVPAGDSHRLAAYALTRYYDPTADRGLGTRWPDIASALGEGDRELLLGAPLRPGGVDLVDGELSYVQGNGHVRRARRRLTAELPELNAYLRTLRMAAVSQRGLLVVLR